MLGSRVLLAAVPAVLVLGALSATAQNGAAMEVVPLILVHGHTSDPSAWGAFIGRYGKGRAVVPALYAGEADQLQPGSLPKACVVAAGYYQENAAEPKYGDKNGSIGGIERTDGFAENYKVSWASRLSRIVDGVLRASGSDHCDLVLHSMGNLVGRAYTRWLSTSGGKCKVRRLLCLEGPHRGINALEALVDGLDNAPECNFMDMGEDAEMCYEWKGWNGKSFTEQLNDGWDGFCSGAGVQYAGVTATGAYGTQSDPNDDPPPKIFGHTFTGAYGDIVTAVEHLRPASGWDVRKWFEICLSLDYKKVWGPIGYPEPHAVADAKEAFGPSDGTVRLNSSRMDQAPFGQAQTWATFEARHGGDPWNPEQCGNNATFVTELCREFCFAGKIEKGGQLSNATLKPVNGPGKATFLALETTVSGAPLVSAQIVEQTVSSTGVVNSASFGYACPLPLGAQRAFISIPAGGGTRRYRLVLYGAEGSVQVQDGLVFNLQDGQLENGPTTSLTAEPKSEGIVKALGQIESGTSDASATTPVASATVHVTASSNTAASDPTLRFSFRLDDGAWSPYTTKATYDSPTLAPGEHRLEARARHANNAAHIVCDDAYGTAIGILVGNDGKVTIRN